MDECSFNVYVVGCERAKKGNERGGEGERVASYREWTTLDATRVLSFEQFDCRWVACRAW
jgi:hypothetical protein